MIKVLIADDELHFLEFMKRVVNWESLGYKIVGTAKNGEETLELAYKLKPAVIFLDINMPRLNGIQMTERLKKEELDIIVIFVTGYSEFEYAKKAIQLGVEEYILKPFSAEEITVVLQKLRLKLRKRHEEGRQLDKERGMVQEWLLMKLITGAGINMEKPELRLQNAGINLYSEYFRVAVIELDQLYEKWSNAEEMSLLRFSISNILQESVSPPGQQYVVHESDHRILSIINFKNEQVGKEFSLEGYETLGILIRKYFNLTITIGIGGLVCGILNLPDSYKKAMAAVKSQFLGGDRRVIYSDELGQDSVRAGFFRVDMNDRLLIALRKRRQEEIYEVLEEIRGDMVRNHFTVDLAHTMLLGLLSLCLSYVTERGGDISAIYGSDFIPYEYINTSTSVDECFKYLTDVFQKAASFRENRNRRSEEILGRILTIIQEQYKNPDLTVEGIANMLYLDISYLRRIFVKEMGMTISDYLTSVRMKEAGRLITKEGYSVADTALQVGYLDPGYFSKCFKKYYSVSPSKYIKGELDEKN